MHMVGNTSYRECRHSVLPSYAAEVGVKTFADVLPNQWSPSSGAEHDVNEAADVTVRHGFSRP